MANFQENNRNKTKIRLIYLVVFLVLLLFFYSVRIILLHRLPPDNSVIPLAAIEEKISIPPRPGVEGIMITGPVVKDLIFQIDTKTSQLRKLNWNRIEMIDKTADVKIRASVLRNGELEFNPITDVISPGHSYAGNEIAKVIKTWKYVPYKHGRIYFWFNFPSSGVKLTVDTHELVRNEEIPKRYFVRNGLLFYIDGLSLSKVNQAGRVFIGE